MRVLILCLLSIIVYSCNKPEGFKTKLKDNENYYFNGIGVILHGNPQIMPQDLLKWPFFKIKKLSDSIIKIL